MQSLQFPEIGGGENVLNRYRLLHYHRHIVLSNLYKCVSNSQERNEYRLSPYPHQTKLLYSLSCAFDTGYKRSRRYKIFLTSNGLTMGIRCSTQAEKANLKRQPAGNLHPFLAYRDKGWR